MACSRNILPRPCARGDRAPTASPYCSSPESMEASRHQVRCQGVWPSGTSYVTFENVKVPVENVIGKENAGFRCIMYNFNHERWGICCQANRGARVFLEEAFRWALKRKTFGKRLIDHPVIRAKLADMVRLIAVAVWHWSSFRGS